MLAVPAFATETDDFYFIEQPKDAFYLGSGWSTFSVSVFGDVASYRWEYRKDQNSEWRHANWSDDNKLLMHQYEDFPEYYFVRCVVTSTSGDVIISDEAALINYPNYFLYYCSRAIHFVTSWVGSITDAFVDPNGAFYSLLPILAIGISVTGFLLVTKIFKSFSWGL